MLRKLRVVNILIMCVLAFTFVSVAQAEEPFRIFNSTTVTSNLDATYIQGDVSKASSQKITVKDHKGIVAEKTLPNTGERCTFRIKVPRSAIETEQINSFAVTAWSAQGEEIKSTFAVIEYKPRKEQEIRIKEKEFKVECPGKPVAIDASSSAGLGLSYSSSNEDVVKVDEKGNIEAVGEGTAEVSVIQANDNEYEEVSETVKVSVKEVPHYTVRYHLGKDSQKINYDEGDEAEAFGEEKAKEAEEEAEGSDDIVIEQKIPAGEEMELLATGESKGDYEFIGWAPSETGVPEYSNAEEVMDIADVDQTVDLYAVWHGERAQKAVDWAIELAADDSFGYGRGSSECCICHNLVKKYTCMPFIAASYAHGIGDLSLLSKGKSGWHYIHLNDRNFTDGKLNGVWEKVGLCRDLTIDDLRPGDVLIKWSANDSTGHAWMYAGDDKIVEAVPASNFADQIAVKNGAAAKLRRYGSSEGTPSKNYVMRYKY